MRIPMAYEDILQVEELAPDPMYIGFYPSPRLSLLDAPREVKIQFRYGSMEFRDDWKTFVYKRVEYRPDFDAEESEKLFRTEHDIPTRSKGKKIKKKNTLIKVSGYDVYEWEWVVLCVGKEDILAEEEFLAQLGAQHVANGILDGHNG